MKLFGFNKDNKKNKFHITDADREWVEENFKWLIKVYGYPARNHGQYLFEQKTFPHTFSGNSILVENLVADLIQIFHLDAGKISCEIETDIRDTYGTPFQIQGRPFETEVEITDTGYKVYIANALTNRPDRLSVCLILDFIYIRFLEHDLDEGEGPELRLFLYLAGIFFGFGVILLQNLASAGQTNDPYWETKWHQGPEVPYEVMTFALATYMSLLEVENPSWVSQLNGSVQQMFINAVQYVKENPGPLFNKRELEANDYLRQSVKHASKREYDEAVEQLQKVIFLTEDKHNLATVYNNIGYYQLRNGELQKSIPNFEKAFALEPKFGYAYSNLGYVLVRCGNPDEGKYYIDKAIDTGNDDPGFTCRNLALYFQAKGDTEQAESYYQQAFQNIVIPIDLLELHYGNFLIEQGQREKGIEYIQQSAGKGEPEALQRLKELLSTP